MQSYDVITVGSAILDVFVKSDKFKVIQSDKVVGGVAVCEVYGGKMEVEQVKLVAGGGGTNTAVSFARKELKTACVVEMGRDVQSEILITSLKQEGVQTEFVIQEPDETTATSVVLIADAGDRSIMIYRGAAGLLTKQDFPFEQLKSRWLHISSLGGNLKLLERILKWAKNNKIRVSLNPGSQEIKSKIKLRRLLSMVEVLFLNREEASDLWDQAYDKKEIWQGEHCPLGPKVTLITDGENGGKMCWGGRCSFWKKNRHIKIVDTTGAGDAFASGYIAGVLYGKNYEEAIEWGRKNAESVITKIGAKAGLLSLSEINLN